MAAAGPASQARTSASARIDSPGNRTHSSPAAPRSTLSTAASQRTRTGSRTRARGSASIPSVNDVSLPPGPAGPSDSAAAPRAAAPCSLFARRRCAIIPRTSDPCSALERGEPRKRRRQRQPLGVAGEHAEHHRRHQPIGGLRSQPAAREVPHALVPAAQTRRHPRLAQQAQDRARLEDPRRERSAKDAPTPRASVRPVPGSDAPRRRSLRQQVALEAGDPDQPLDRGVGQQEPGGSGLDRPLSLRPGPRLAADRGRALEHHDLDAVAGAAPRSLAQAFGGGVRGGQTRDARADDDQALHALTSVDSSCARRRCAPSHCIVKRESKHSERGLPVTAFSCQNLLTVERVRSYTDSILALRSSDPKPLARRLASMTTRLLEAARLSSSCPPVPGPRRGPRRSTPQTLAPTGAEFQVNTFTVDLQNLPAISADGDGDFVVVWASRRDGYDYGIFGQRWSSAGAPLGAEFQVNVHDQQHADSAQAWQPKPTAASSSRWFSFLQDGDTGGIFARRFSAARHAARGRVPGQLLRCELTRTFPPSPPTRTAISSSPGRARTARTGIRMASSPGASTPPASHRRSSSRSTPTPSATRMYAAAPPPAEGAS